MPKFRLSGVVTVSAYTVVQAPTLAEAIAIAEDRQAVIGGAGTLVDENECWIIEEADGMAEDIHEAG